MSHSGHRPLPRYCGSRARQYFQSGPFPVFPPQWLRCSAPLTSMSSCPNPSKGEKTWLAARGPYHHRPIRGCHGFRFRSPGCLRRGLKGVFLCDTARMARLMAALIFKLIPSSCRRLFFCVPLGATSLHARILCAFGVMRPREN